ncbi:MAG: TonB-dependent receptor, partial [Pseudomonadota bacterium]|nr:TonB-dependent receptor [Pseudomonadota bacterium]
ASSIAIRGFGNGSHGGDLGVVIDGIPLNEANSHEDGYVDLNVIIPLEIDSMTVYRGPVSALYGNFNRGGLIALESRKTGDYSQADLSVGSFETFDAQAAFGRSVGDRQQYNGAFQFYRTDGFRPQSRAERGTFAGRATLMATNDLDVSLSTRLHKADADSASYITHAQFRTDPFGIDPRTQNDGAEKNFGTLRADVNYTLSPSLKLLTFAYATQQDFTRWFSRPSGPAPMWRQREESYDRRVYGVGTSLNGRLEMGERTVNFVAGVEGFHETTGFLFFDGLDNRRRVNPGQFDRESVLESVAAFVQADIPLHRLLDLSLGLRADRFTGDCRRTGPETVGDQCSEFEGISNFSPKIGLRSQVLPWLQLRTSFAEGFALPSDFAKYSVGGQDLDVSTLRQFEVGAKVLLGTSVDFDIAHYRIKSTNEIRQTAPGEFENFGETLRRGVEASMTWVPTDTLEFKGAFGRTYSNIEVNANPSIIGNYVSGVPDYTGTLTATWNPIAALSLNATGRYVGQYFVNAANSIEAPSYTLLDLGASYAVQGRMPFNVFFNIDNVADRKYASSFNAATLAPGMPRSYRVGVQFDF